MNAVWWGVFVALQSVPVGVSVFCALKCRRYARSGDVVHGGALAYLIRAEKLFTPVQVPQTWVPQTLDQRRMSSGREPRVSGSHFLIDDVRKGQGLKP